MIELVEGYFINPAHVTLVKALGENQCALFFVGSSAIDGGHLLPYAASEVAEVVTEAMDGEYEGEDQEEE